MGLQSYFQCCCEALKITQWLVQDRYLMSDDGQNIVLASALVQLHGISIWLSTGDGPRVPRVVTCKLVVTEDARQLSVCELQIRSLGTSLVVQWLRLCACSAGGLGSIPGQRTRWHMLQLENISCTTRRFKILHATTKTQYRQVN